MTGVSWREKQRRIREEAIIEAARELFVRHGYDAMSMDDVASRVGVSKATLYNHFASKEELVIEVIIAAIRQGEATLASLSPDVPAINRLQALIGACVESRVELAALKINLLPHRLENHKRFQEQRRSLTASMMSLIDHAKKEGAIADFLPTGLVCDFIFALIAGGIEMEKARNTAEPEDVSNLFTSILFRGICVMPYGGQPAVPV